MNRRADREDPRLFGPRVARALASLAGDTDELSAITRLRKDLPPELARLAAELHVLRRRALGRFPEGHVPFLTRRGLEQASSFAVASYRAGEVAARASGAWVWDATSGIGADSIALARLGLRVVTSDRDLFTLRCARANLEHHGLAPRTVLADATTAPVDAGGVLIDPDRRPGGRRTLDVEKWSPTLVQSLELARRAGAGCVQLAPAFDPATLDRVMDPRKQGVRLAWISFRGQLASVDLWCGAWSDRAEGVAREVVVLDGSGGATRFAGRREDVPPLSEGEARRVAWLATPDPGVIRSGLLGALARREGLAPLAPAIAFLAGERAPRSALLRAWRVLGTSPLDPKRVRALLRTHGIGAVQVLKRGHPDPAQDLARRFQGPGERPGWLAVARLERGHLALLVEPAAPRVGDEGFEPPTSSL